MKNKAIEFLVQPWFVSIAIPIIFLLCGSFARKLVRGSKLEPKDFYLGIEFALASVSAALVYIYDLGKEMAASNPVPPTAIKQMAATASFLAVTFLMLLYILSVHQDWDKTPPPKGQFLRLGLAMNLLGGGMMCAFILLVKGV